MLSGVVSATAGAISVGTGVMTLKQLREQMRRQASTEVDLELGLNNAPQHGRGEERVVGVQREMVQSQASSATVVNVTEPARSPSPSQGQSLVWTGMK